MKNQSLSHALRPFALVTIIACLCLVPATRRTHAQPALVDIGTLGGDNSISQGINAMGQVVGYSYLADNATQHAFLWTPDVANGTTGTMVDLGVLGGSYSIAYGINDLGVVVGTSSSVGRGHARVRVDPDGPNAGTRAQMSDIGTLGGGSESEARDINNSGQIVGMVVLDRTLPRPGWRLTRFCGCRTAPWSISARCSAPKVMRCPSARMARSPAGTGTATTTPAVTARSCGRRINPTA